MLSEKELTFYDLIAEVNRRFENLARSAEVAIDWDADLRHKLMIALDEKTELKARVAELENALRKICTTLATGQNTEGFEEFLDDLLEGINNSRLFTPPPAGSGESRTHHGRPVVRAEDAKDDPRWTAEEGGK